MTLTISDIEFWLKLLDVSSERGTWKGSELTLVGQHRDKVAAFLSNPSGTTEETPSEEATAPVENKE